MKTYIITEKDIERLRAKFFPIEQNEVDRWVETLNELPIPEKLNLSWKVPDDYYSNRAKYCVNIELENPKDVVEFEKFVDDNGFTKPSQPYYIRNGEILNYSDLRKLFLESRKTK